MARLYFLFICLLACGVLSAQENLSKEEKERREKNIQAGNPFKKFGYKSKVATLSKGKYLEVHDLDSIVIIGSIKFHVDRQQIVGLVEIDSTESQYSRPLGDEASRWIAMDPKSEESRRWSPYNYCMDNPVFFIDPDGMSAVPPDDHFDTAGNYLYTDMRPTNNIVIDEKVVNYSTGTTETKETQLKDYTFNEISYFALSNIGNHYAPQAGVELSDVHNGKISVSDVTNVVNKGSYQEGQLKSFNNGVFSADDVYGGRTLMNTKGDIVTINLQEGKIDPLINDKNNFTATLDHEGGPIGHMVNPQKVHSDIYKDEISKYKGSVTPEFLQHLNTNLKMYKKAGQ